MFKASACVLVVLFCYRIAESFPTEMFQALKTYNPGATTVSKVEHFAQMKESRKAEKKRLCFHKCGWIQVDKKNKGKFVHFSPDYVEIEPKSDMVIPAMAECGTSCTYDKSKVMYVPVHSDT